jgi:tRNA modification GTPase
MHHRSDTIAAIATPLGRGGVGVVRVSGFAAREIGERLFRSARQGFAGFRPYRLHHGWVHAPLGAEEAAAGAGEAGGGPARGAVLDECLAAWMPGPGSYTGEDVLEFQCHGGPAVLGAVLEAALAAGARQAEAGEFTYRAFMNGRLDLTRAEAVAEMVAAPTRPGAQLAAAALSGALAERVRGLRLRLEQLSAGVCLAVDFPDEDIECLSREDFGAGVEAAARDVAELLDAARRARPWREGALVVLAGRVNAGKSSLMNALLGRERAIVCDTPGTTRDFLEEGLDLGGLPVRLVDTAGLRQGRDAAERAGVARSKELIERADLVLLVVDGSWDLPEEDRTLARDLGPERVLAVLTKSDLPGGGAVEWFEEVAFPLVRVSAHSGQGLDRLTQTIRQRITGHDPEPAPGALAPNLRQSEALQKALAELRALQADITAQVPYDLLGVRLETACALLSEITGDLAPDEVLEAVFARFCIGK